MTPTLESVRSYWDSRPCNIRHSPEQLGTREYFDQVETRKYYVEPHIPKFAEFPKWDGLRVLEIGCGIGTDTINFARAGARVSAIDLSEESVKIAKQRAMMFGLQNRIRFYTGNAEDLRSYITAEDYDLIYSFGVIHHSPHPEKIVQELQHYTAEGTTLKLMIYNKLSWKVFWILMKWGIWEYPLHEWERAVADYSEAQTGCPITFTYTKDQARALVEDAGFTVKNIDVEHIFPYKIPEYIRYRYKKVWYFRVMPADMFAWLEHQIGWHLCITAVKE